MEYYEFLKNKAVVDIPTGLTVIPELNKSLYDFQRDITRWALKRGRAAIFADCGLYKTGMQSEWAKHVPGNVLILAPLAVAPQTVMLAKNNLDIEIKYCRDQDQVKPGISITNYEMLDHFDPSYFTGIVLDESSILKSYSGKFRNQIVDSFQNTPFRLACTATPAPNDYMELGNHSEFLGVMSRTEMLAMFFVHDGGDTAKWRLKGHAKNDFWRWICSWAVNIRKPSDLGYDDGLFTLPEMTIEQHTVKVDQAPDGFLFPVEALTLQERQHERKSTIVDRVAECARIVAEKPDEQWLIWCNLNEESAQLKAAIDGAVEVKGADSIEHKEKSVIGFQDGTISRLVSKASMFGYGLNLQNCHNMAFVGLSDSYEQFYQAVRRCWRFGQKEAVKVHVITAETEGAVVRNIERKEADAMSMAENMVENMKSIETKNIRGASADKSVYVEESVETENYTLWNGDSCEIIKRIPDNSMHFSIFSPPFASLYTYSNSDRDMGNVKNDKEFADHFRFLVPELYRITKPGRLLAFHCMNLPTSKERDGVIGIRDFRGELIRVFTDNGWIFHSEVCIWKDPVTAMQRTKALGLLHKQIKKDSCMNRQGIPDYLVVMRKPGDNTEPVTHTNDTFPVAVWQRYASPVWAVIGQEEKKVSAFNGAENIQPADYGDGFLHVSQDINPSDTLQRFSVREDADERHICPLQIQVVERAVDLWTNPGDTVFTPFAGIGTELVVPLQMGRKSFGIELKTAYWKQAVNNCKEADSTTAKQLSLGIK